MSSITVNGIVRYPHLVTPSCAKDSEKLQYSVSILINKSDINTINMIKAALDAATLERFPNGTPHDFRTCFYDLAIIEPQNIALKDYWSLKMSSDVGQNVPHLVDAARQPIITTNEVKSGVMGWFSGFSSAYNQKGKGVKVYLNGSMISNDMGAIPPESLSNQSTAMDLFSGVNDGFSNNNLQGSNAQQQHVAQGLDGGSPHQQQPLQQAQQPLQQAHQPVPNQPLQQAPQQQAPQQQAPQQPPQQQAPQQQQLQQLQQAGQAIEGQAQQPPQSQRTDTPQQPVHQMTALANGNSYEQFIASQWTDQQLIEQGMMLPPNAAPTLF